MDKIKITARLTSDRQGKPGLVFEDESGEFRSEVLGHISMTVLTSAVFPGTSPADAMKVMVASQCGVPHHDQVEVDVDHVKFLMAELKLQHGAWMKAKLDRVQEAVDAAREAANPPAWKIAAIALGGTFLVSLAVFGAARLTHAK